MMCLTWEYFGRLGEHHEGEGNELQCEVRAEHRPECEEADEEVLFGEALTQRVLMRRFNDYFNE